MFPNAESEIYYNEAGEVLGWDNPSYYEPEYPDYDNYNDDVYDDDYDGPESEDNE